MTPNALAGASGVATPVKVQQRRRKQPQALLSTAKPEAYQRAFSQLCHILPLSRTGKVRQVVDSLVLMCFGLDASVDLESAADVVEALDALFGVKLDAADVRRSVDGHLEAGHLLRAGKGKRLSLAPATLAEVERRLEDGRQVESTVQTEWQGRLRAAGRSEAEITGLWRCLRHYLAKAFCRHGVLTAELLDPVQCAPTSDVLNLRALLDKTIEETCGGLDPEGIRAEVLGFLEERTAARTAYIARLLDGTFTFFALQANEASGAYLRDNLKPLKLFLDTNFILGLLDLHDNPMRELCKELVRFIHEHHFPFTFHYHERTLKELRVTLDNAASRLRARRWSPELSRVACQRPELSGIDLAYHRLNAERPVDVDVFLSKFDHVEELLADFGAKLYRTLPGPAGDTMSKGQLIEEYRAYVATLRPEGHARPYESADHDMVVWMTLQQLRQKGTSALDVGALFLSADFLLSRFDWTKLRARNEVGTVVLPDQFLQVLRPYARSDADFDQRFVDAFLLPEFRAAHSDYGKTIPLVLSYLATYENMNERTAVRLLSNELLLGQLRGVEEGSREFAEFMDKAIAQDHLILLEEAEALRVELEQERRAKESALAETQAQLRETADELAQVTSAVEARVEAVRCEVQDRHDERVAEVRAEEEARRRPLEQQVAQLTTRLDEAEARRGRWGRKLRWVAVTVAWVAVAIMSVVVPHLTAWRWLLQHDHLVGIYGCFYVLTGGAAWAMAAPSQWKRILGGAAGALVVAVLGVLMGLL